MPSLLKKRKKLRLHQKRRLKLKRLKKRRLKRKMPSLFRLM